MPAISVIVPVYNVEGFVRECIQSITRQTFGDFEIIAVDDASTDSSGSVVAQLAEGDRRIRVITLAENGGLANARNVGIDAAGGEYLLFVDSDDWLEPDALEVLHARAESSGADVVMFDYARVYWWGKRQRNVLGHHLDDAGAPVITLHDRPGLISVLNVAWNKLYRRAFIEAHGFRLPPGFYEDIPWTYPVLLTAQSIAPVDRALYNYRQRRSGGILRSTDPRHFDVFDQYRRLFDLIDARPDAGEWHPVFFEKMVDHYLTILSKGEVRIPKGLRRRFFALAAEQSAALRPRGFNAPARGRRGIMFRLLLAGRYGTFQFLKRANRVYLGLRSAARRLRRWLRRSGRAAVQAVNLAGYRMYRRLPVAEDLVVFAAYWYRQYAGNPAAISEKLGELAPSMRRVWVLAEDAVGTPPPGVEVVRPGSSKYYRLLARAKYLVNNVNFPDFMVKRKGTIHLQTKHGTPIKHMGLDLLAHPAASKEMDFIDLLARSERWDYVLSSNRYSTEVWRRAFPLGFETLEFGYPGNDLFFHYSDEAGEEVREELGIPAQRTVVLYAPTFRDYRREFESHLDLHRLRRALGDRFALIVRAHYLQRGDPEDPLEGFEGFAYDATLYPDLGRLCLAADVLVTDYSSIMFDFANLSRPIVVFADDWETYSTVRGTYLDITTETPPGIVATTQEDLEKALVTGEYESDQARDRLATFRARFCEFDDGLAAERVVRRVFLGEPNPGVRG